MSEVVASENGDLRSRLRTTPINHRTSSYRSRTHAPRHTAPPGNGFVSDFVVTPKPTAEPVKSKAAPAQNQQASQPKFTDIKKPVRHVSPRRQAIAQPSKYQSIAALIQMPDEVYSTEPKRAQKATVGHTLQRTQVLNRSFVAKPSPPSERQSKTPPKKLRLSQQKLIMAMAVCVFLFGVVVSLMGLMSNRAASAQAVTASKQVDAKSAVATTGGTQPSDEPSTTPVSEAAVKAYTVAPDLARYITIPEIGVHARVLQVGVTTDGALGTPANVFDTAWYTGSAKPGQPGATLIDGHVSSWTSNGVFYNLKKLNAGSQIQIEKGDGNVLTYIVQKVVAYDANNVDMQAMMLPVQAGKSGLNLMTCGGKYDSKSKEFTQRIAVFSVLQS